MRRQRELLLFVGLGFGLSGCAAQELCDDSDDSGPSVSVDLAFPTCNHRPLARFVGPGTIRRNALVRLDATRSSDVDGDDLDFRWGFRARPPESAAELTIQSRRFASFTSDLPGDYTVELIVNDGQVDSEPFVATLKPVNLPPVASAGNDVTVGVGGEATLDGTGSTDPEGDVLTYAWTLALAPMGSTAQLADATSARARLRADVRGVFEVELRVNDGEATSAPASIRVGAGVSPNPPVADAGPPQSVQVGEVVHLSGQASSDRDGDPLSYRWTILERPGGSAALSGATSVDASFVPDALGTWKVELTVDDGFYRASDSVEVTVERDTNPVGPSTFDFSRIYFYGTLTPGDATQDVLCDPQTPNTPSAGFDSESRGGLISPVDGAYVYYEQDAAAGTSTLRRFKSDPLTWDAQFGVWQYPDQPHDNDPVIQTAACPNQVWRFVMRPGTGEIVHQCQGTNDWYDMQGNQVAVCDPYNGTSDKPVALGYDGSMLCEHGIRDTAGVTHGLVHGGLVGKTWRARPAGGFWLGYWDGTAYQRIILHTDGTDVVELTYPTPPNNLLPSNVTLADSAGFDAAGNFYAAMSVPTRPDFVIVRFAGDLSPGQIIYDESTNPICKMDFAYLLSGP